MKIPYIVRDMSFKFTNVIPVEFHFAHGDSFGWLYDTSAKLERHSLIVISSKIFYFNFQSHFGISEALYSRSRKCWLHFTLTNKNRQNIPAAAADWWKMSRKYSHTAKVLANTILFINMLCIVLHIVNFLFNKIKWE